MKQDIKGEKKRLGLDFTDFVKKNNKSVTRMEKHDWRRLKSKSEISDVR